MPPYHQCARELLRNSATPTEHKASAPILNEHVEEVLAAAGITAEQHQALIDGGVVRKYTGP